MSETPITSKESFDPSEGNPFVKSAPELTEFDHHVNGAVDLANSQTDLDSQIASSAAKAGEKLLLDQGGDNLLTENTDKREKKKPNYRARKATAGLALLGLGAAIGVGIENYEKHNETREIAREIAYVPSGGTPIESVNEALGELLNRNDLSRENVDLSNLIPDTQSAATETANNNGNGFVMPGDSFDVILESNEAGTKYTVSVEPNIDTLELDK